MEASQEIRWQYRFRNFTRAFHLLRSALEDGVDALNELEREGVIQRFEYTFELAWKVLKDRMEYDGVVIVPSVTPRNVIRQAFLARIIENCETWMDMLTDRNLMSHTYDFDIFAKVVGNIAERYIRVLEEMYLRLGEEMVES